MDARVIGNPMFVSLCTGLVVLVVLVLLNPPFVQKRMENPIHRASPDLIKASVYSIVVAVMVYVIPILASKTNSCNEREVR